MKNQSKVSRYAIATLFSVVILSAGSVALAGSCGGQHDIVDTAVENGSFNTLVAAVKAAGLVDALKGEGPFTVFAPTDAAFAKLPAGTVEMLLKPENKDQLVAILTYHVVPGKILSTDVKPGRVDTLQGSQIKVSKQKGALKIDQASIVAVDVTATNGVIHVIDEVIMPKKARSAS